LLRLSKPQRFNFNAYCHTISEMASISGHSDLMILAFLSNTPAPIPFPTTTITAGSIRFPPGLRVSALRNE
jgi:hypothetical protein